MKKPQDQSKILNQHTLYSNHHCIANSAYLNLKQLQYRLNLDRIQSLGPAASRPSYLGYFLTICQRLLVPGPRGPQPIILKHFLTSCKRLLFPRPRGPQPIMLRQFSYYLPKTFNPWAPEPAAHHTSAIFPTIC